MNWALIGAVHPHAAIVEIQRQHVDHALAAEFIRAVQAAQAQHRGGGTFQHRGAGFRRIRQDGGDLGGAGAAAGGADARSAPAGRGAPAPG